MRSFVLPCEMCRGGLTIVAAHGTCEPFFEYLTRIMFFVLATEPIQLSQQSQKYANQMPGYLRAVARARSRAFDLIADILVSGLPVFLSARL